MNNSITPKLAVAFALGALTATIGIGIVSYTQNARILANMEIQVHEMREAASDIEASIQILEGIDDGTESEIPPPIEQQSWQMTHNAHGGYIPACDVEAGMVGDDC